MNLFSRFAKDISGNFALIFAICIVPVFGAAGLAVDFSRAYSAHSQLQQAADAAVLGAVNEAQAQIAQGKTQSAALALGEVLGRSLFASNIEPIAGSISGMDFKVAVTANNGIIRGAGNVSGIIQGTLAKAIGMETTPLTVSAKAEAGLSKYLEVHFVVDTSISMGIGATARDQQITTDRTGCAIACHTENTHKNYYNSLPEARAAGAKLRIDVVKDAIAAMLAEFEAEGVNGNRLQLVLHTFSNTLTTEVSATTDLNIFRTGLSKIDLNGKDLQGGTDITAALTTLEQRIGTSGSGYGPSDRQIIVLIVTDGVATDTAFDSKSEGGFIFNPDFTNYTPQIYGNQGFPSQGFNPRDCDRLKNRRKVTMATLNVRYLIPKVGNAEDTRFPEIEKILLPDIAEHMKLCASDPSLAMWADSPETIEGVMRDLVTEITGGTLRLTQ